MSNRLKLIVNADDFGHDADTAAATIACFEQGLLSSATLMPNMPATLQAARFARGCQDFSFGVHLTFARDTVESPVLPADRIPTLAAPDGGFRAIRAVRLLALFGRIELAQIEAEMAAQIAAIFDLGVRISHVDSHHHVHKLGPFRDALTRVLPRFGIKRVRAVQDLFCGAARMRPTAWLGKRWNADLRRRFTTTDHFFMLRGTPARAPKQIDAMLDSDASLEFGYHPGRAESWRKAETRFGEAFVGDLRSRGVRLIDWRAL